MITVKKNTLIYNDKSFQCAIGKRGTTEKKIEGDGYTPLGTYLIKEVFYRRDRINLPNISFPIRAIESNFGWCDDINSKEYNKLIKFPFKESAEKLFRSDNIYDIVCVLNYNLDPIIKNKGSAIFLHIARDDYSGTQGCVAISEKNLVLLLTLININTKLNIIN
jgi:L,D-peptidoglycan transpeptidase YkuD (ErfK/YbiS/YcfS/YnhG family)